MSVEIAVAILALLIAAAGLTRAWRKRSRTPDDAYILQRLPDIAGAVDDLGHWLSVSPAVERILGHRSETLVGRLWMDDVHPDDMALMLERGDTGAPQVLRIKHRDGQWVWMEWHLSAPSRFGSDNICRIVAARDITTRKQAELAQIQAHARLAQQASIDGLTGLFNRSHIQAMLDRECLRARRSGHPLCVLLIDVDHFKPLNDYYGHPHGDLCLTAVARCLNSALLRPADVVGRYGGEEFMVLLPDTDARGMEIVAEKIRQAVQDMAQPHSASPFGHITVSVGGIHVMAPVQNDPTRYISLADNALYRAKRLGRNRVVCASCHGLAEDSPVNPASEPPPSGSKNIALASN